MRQTSVTAADGRVWLLSRHMEWRWPDLGDEFEHDVDAGRGAVAALLALVVAFWVFLAVWMPAGVQIPWGLWLVAAVAIGFFPVRWLYGRPYTIVAETEGSAEYPAEYWIGLVRRRRAAQEEYAITIRSLRTRATPGHADSPLQPLN